MQTTKIVLLTVVATLLIIAAATIAYTQLATAQNTTATQTPPLDYRSSYRGLPPGSEGNGTTPYFCYPYPQGAYPNLAAPYQYGRPGMCGCGRFW